MPEPEPTSRTMPHDLDVSPSEAQLDDAATLAQLDPSVSGPELNPDATPWEMLLALGFRP